MREEADAGHERAVPAAVAATEELVPAAHREQRRTRAHGVLDRRPFRREIRRDERLLAILAAADVVEIVCARLDRVTDPERVNRERVAVKLGAPREHRDVPAVGVDVQVVRIEMSDTQPHRGVSQYAGTTPRSVRIPRRASMAV